MKTLLVMRHAKSSWKDESLPDFERPLNKRGKEDAKRMAKFILAEGLCPDIILSSPARRARKTADAVHRECGEAVLNLIDTLYPGDSSRYIAALSELDDSIVAAMIIGHNPGLEDWLRSLGVETDRFPTAALARVEVPIESWTEMRESTVGALRGFWKPRSLA